MDQYQLWANIAGVAGFIVSSCLAIFEWRSRRIKIKVSKAIVITKKTLGSLFILQLVFSNRSSLPISITSAELLYGKRNVPNLMDGLITLETSSPEKKRVAVTSILPIDIQPYSAREIIFQFPQDEITKPLLDMVEADEESKTSQSEDLFLIIGTSRGCKRLPLEAEFKDLDIWFHEYSDILELRDS